MRNKLESPDTGSEKDWLTHSSSHTGEETLFANEFVYAIFPGSNPPDSAAKINNLYHQYGFSNDTSPNSRLHSVIYEIAYRTGGAVVPGGGVEHEREPFPTHVAQWREHPWTMRAHGRR
jgi:hypothetical protein